MNSTEWNELIIKLPIFKGNLFLSLTDLIKVITKKYIDCILSREKAQGDDGVNYPPRYKSTIVLLLKFYRIENIIRFLVNNITKSYLIEFDKTK